MTDLKSISMRMSWPGSDNKVKVKTCDNEFKRSHIINGTKLNLVHLRLKLSLLGVAIKHYNRPIDWIKALRDLIRLRRKFLGNHRLRKMVYADGKYYMGLYTPGWNSSVYKNFIAAQLNDFKEIKSKTNRFNTVFIAITKKCALQCDHCYEWENLNKKDVLSTKEIKQIIEKLQFYGVGQFQFSGGEPLLKIDTLEEVVALASKKTDCWIATSGFKFTNENAKRLKKSGLTGIIISLDHFIPEKHNAFRHFNDAYYWVEQAICNAYDQNLVVALSVCVTREFVSHDNLMSYMHLAKKFNIAFVQFLEPKPIGHYKNMNVTLDQEHLQILEKFFLKMNFDSEFETFPIITYHGYYQRRQGCYSAGIKGFYVDTDGDINACPFCNKKSGNVLDVCFEDHITTLQRIGCNNYN